MTQKIWRDSVWIAKSAWRGDDFSNTGKQIKKSEPFMTRSDKAMSSGYLEQQQNHKTRSQHRPSIQDLITSCDQQQKCHPKEQTGFRKYFAHRGNGNILQQPSATSWLCDRGGELLLSFSNDTSRYFQDIVPLYFHPTTIC